MISFKNVYKYYPYNSGKRSVLNNINFNIKHGDDTAILGRNGAGKSTLFRLISGTESCDRGEIYRDGMISWPLGFSGGFHGSLSGRENVRFVARIYGQDTRKIFNFVDEFSELDSYIDMPVKSYSSGMKARLAFGLSMAIDFDFYLIDEVIAVGDTAFKKKCKRILNEKRQSSTVILVSHSNSMLKQFCKKGAVLDRGELILFDNIEEAISVHEANQKKLEVKAYEA